MRNYNMPGADESHCGCKKDSPYMQNEYALAMAYVPWQHFANVYEPDKALEIGTIFPELDKPFWAGRGIGRR